MALSTTSEYACDNLTYRKHSLIQAACQAPPHRGTFPGSTRARGSDTGPERADRLNLPLSRRVRGSQGGALPRQTADSHSTQGAPEGPLVPSNTGPSPLAAALAIKGLPHTRHAGRWRDLRIRPRIEMACEGQRSAGCDVRDGAQASTWSGRIRRPRRRESDTSGAPWRCRHAGSTD
jgi:hypothetical protein